MLFAAGMSLVPQIVAWDTPGAPALSARMSPQEALDQGLSLPSACDVTVGILWSRVGTPFEYNGNTYGSGTLYELEDALDGYNEVFIYRRREAIAIDPSDPKADDRLAQWRAVDAYFASFNDETGAAVRGYNTYGSTTEFEELLTTHLKNYLVDRLAEDTPGEVASPPARWEGSPFPGLRSFTTADAPIFFGRGRETDELLRKVAAQRVVLVMGASGSGKSSIVGAGLIPRLKAGALPGSDHWHLPDFNVEHSTWRGPRFSPAELGANPLEPLVRSLFPDANDKPGLVSSLANDPWSIDDALTESPLAEKDVLVFLDQFEEFFTSVDPTYRGPFVKLLSHSNPKLRWVITVRSDFYHRCVDIPALARLLEQGQFPLSVPTTTLLDMITRPAQRAHVEFEEGLTRQILEDTGYEPGSLALMAYALDELYAIANRRGDCNMRIADYASLGGVQGAIGKRAEGVFRGLTFDIADHEQRLGEVFRELLEVDERGVATRRRATLESVSRNEQAAKLVQDFVAARLLTASEGPQGPQIEVAHEALLRSWDRLAEWINTVQADLLLLRQLRHAAREWADNGFAADYLWLGERSNEVQKMLARLNPQLDDTERCFAKPESEHLVESLADERINHVRRDSIGQRLLLLGDPRPGVGCRDARPDITWSPVAAPPNDQPLEFPDHDGAVFCRFSIRSFLVSTYPVTKAQFEAFLNDPDGASMDQWWVGFDDEVREPDVPNQTGSNHPRDSVSWHQAVAFCRWLDATLPSAERPNRPGGGDYEIRLPHECEWQWASLGADQTRDFPWGAWDPSMTNLKEAGIARTVAVGLYPQSASPGGALDMVGNLRQWCLNVYKEPEVVEFGGKRPRVLRGGSIYQDYVHSTARYRSSNAPKHSSREAGFRVVFAPKIGG